MNYSKASNGFLEYHALEVQYQRNLGDLQTIQAAEDARRLRVRILYLEEENVDLHNMILRKEEQIEAIEESLDKANESIDIKQAELNILQGDMRSKMRGMHNLKTEINSLQSVSAESAKLLAEKLTLSREMSILKPELEHLRAQQNSNQGLLAEKLALQRDLNTVRVELDAEKRALQRAISKEDAKSGKDMESKSEIESLRTELQKEKTERQSLERRAQKASTESDNQIAILESRVENFRAKLKSAKEQLKETQSQLEVSRQQLDNLAKRKHIDAPRNARKRNILQSEEEGVLATPDGLPASKKQKRGSTLLGDKSNFSITPFLNRTMSIAPEPPEDAQPDVPVETHEQQASRIKAVSPLRSDQAPRSTKQTLKNQDLVSTSKKANGTRKASEKLITKLDKVREEDEEVGQHFPPVEVDNVARPTQSTGSEALAGSKALLPKKKRKVLGNALGKTLFDDEDGPAGNDLRGGLDELKFTLTKRVGLAPKVVFQGGKGNVRSLAAFGDFSPLKKDRKS